MRSRVPSPLLRRAALVAACAVALAPAAPSADPAMEAAGDDGAPTLHGALRLSLGDAIAMALENNLDVEIARHAPLIAEEDLMIAWGAFDPLVTGDVGYFDDEQPNTFAIAGVARTKQDSLDGGLGFSTLLPYVGATLGMEYTGARTTNNSVLQTLRPQYDSGLAFTANVPLARDLVWNQPWTQVKLAGLGSESSTEGFRADVMDVVAGIEASYWNVVATIEQQRVAEKSLETARALLDQVKTQYEVGVVSKVEVVEAEAGVAERDVNFIRAENDTRRAQDTLIDAVLGPHLTAASRLRIEPTDTPEEVVEYEVDVETAVDRAFERRPELRSAEYALESTEVSLRFAKNQRLPSIDVQAGYTTSGRRGVGAANPDIFDRDNDGDTTELVVNPTTGSSISRANHDFFNLAGGEQYSVRGIVSIPLGNVAGRHGVTKAEIELRRAKTQLLRLRQSIILEVRDGARNLLSAQQGIEAAERRRAAAAEQLRAERVRLEHGESTPFEVLQRERDLVDAESQKIAALQLYRTSETELLRAQGTILEARNVVVDDVRPLR